MKLTRKLSLAIGLGILVILFVQAWTRFSLDRNSYRDDVQRDHEILGETIASIAEGLYRTDGLGRALEIIEGQNAYHPNMTIRWVEVGPNASPDDRPRIPQGIARAENTPYHFVDERGPVPAILSYVDVDVPGREGAVELVETIEGERRSQRTSMIRAAMTTGSVVLLCFVITAGFGVFFVARPLRQLTELTEAVGRGDFDRRVDIRQKDEIRDLAIAFEAMTLRLRSSREAERDAVADRIRALEQLRHSDRLRTIGEIASALAHELGTPLNVVRARGSMIASGEVPAARARELGGVIVTQVDRMSSILRSLLDFGRREPSKVAPATVRSIVEQVVDLVEPLARERGVRLRHTVVEELPISADRAHLGQALTNLVVNAIHASSDGGEVRVSAGSDDTRVWIDVDDEGRGMDDEVLAHAMEPFVTTKSAGEGTGLGLPIANEIAIEHGGRLTLARREPVGIRARLELARPGRG